METRNTFNRSKTFPRFDAATAALFLLLCLLPAPNANAEPPGSAAKPPPGVRERLAGGTPQELLVLFDDDDIEAEAKQLRRNRNINHDDQTVLEVKERRFREVRRQVLAKLPAGEFETKREYSHLPMAFLRFFTPAALERLLARPEVLAVYENGILYHQLTQSLPLIKQPQAASIGLTGSGTSVAVIDTGLNYSLSAFGSCTAPGVPAGCRVSASVDIAPDDGALDAHGHGTNVAGIIAGTASAAKIISLDVFDGDSASFSDVIDGINWAIANKSTYNIIALNMSLGDGDRNTAACGNQFTNPFVTPINNARAAGIIPVAASGNEGYTDGLSKPACTPGVISVGAVYDANLGSRSWSICTDSTTQADKVACFSNSASFLTILAPGALITAGGYIMGGTSQASPHVAGAVAALRGAFPGETLDQTLARMTSGGVSVTDTRTGIAKPRLNLLAAAGAPGNDSFAAADLRSGSSGSVSGESWNATKESGEPNHAGSAGGASVWWKWTPSVTGTAVVNTHGSGFDTLLAVYTGTTVASLTPLASNDNDGSSGGAAGMGFTAVAGTEYRIAVDGAGGASGAVALAWSLSIEADLELGLSTSPPSPQVGENLAITLTTFNHGPSTASGITVTTVLPEQVLFISASSGCSAAGSTVVCDQGDLASGFSTEATIIVRPESSGTLHIMAEVSSGTTDQLPDNNSVTASYEVPEPPPAVPALSAWGIAGIIASLGACLRRRSGIDTKQC
ncbi:MAG: S8 family serine peptidase [Pseudomonadota bacterium]